MCKVYAGMVRPISFDRVWFPRVIMAGNAPCRPIMCVFQGVWWHSTPNVVRSYVHSKGHDGMQSSTSSDRVCNPRTMMACHAWHCPSICALQGRWWHAIPHLIWLYVLSKVYALKHTRRQPAVCAIQGILRHSRYDIDRIVCCPREIMASHTRRHQTVFNVQGPWWHAMPDIFHLYV